VCEQPEDHPHAPERHRRVRDGELFVRWNGAAPLVINDGESFLLWIDGQLTTLAVPESAISHSGECERRCQYDKRGYYPVTAAVLHQIANACIVIVEDSLHWDSP
jgi:hypothetical protein